VKEKEIIDNFIFEANNNAFKIREITLTQDAFIRFISMIAFKFDKNNKLNNIKKVEYFSPYGKVVVKWKV